MTTFIKTRLIKIGNSQGFRVPKALLEQCDIESDIEMHVQSGQIIIRSAKKVRQGWADHFASMAQNEDDQLLDESSLSTASQWDEADWQW